LLAAGVRALAIASSFSLVLNTCFPTRFWRD
jgi:hypothetical protein